MVGSDVLKGHLLCDQVYHYCFQEGARSLTFKQIWDSEQAPVMTEGRMVLCLMFGEVADNCFLSDFQHEDGVFCTEPASPSDIQRTRGSLDTKK